MKLQIFIRHNRIFFSNKSMPSPCYKKLTKQTETSYLFELYIIVSYWTPSKPKGLINQFSQYS